MAEPQGIGSARCGKRAERISRQVVAEELQRRLVVLADDDGGDLFPLRQHAVLSRRRQNLSPSSVPAAPRRQLENGARRAAAKEPVRSDAAAHLDDGALAVEEEDVKSEPHPEGVDAA